MELRKPAVELVLEQGEPRRAQPVKLLDGFIFENERVLVKVQRVLNDGIAGAVRGVVGQQVRGEDRPPHANETYWVDVRDLKVDEPLILRSEMWELTDGPDRETLLRSLAVVLARQDSFHSYRIDLAAQVPGDVELLFYNAIKPGEGVAYQASLAPIRLRSNPRSLPWQPPDRILSSRTAPSKERYDSHVGHLPLWLQSRRLWSVYLWDQERPLHVFQFSLSQRLRPAIEARFKLKPV